MRIKINLDIIKKPKEFKKISNHTVQAMLLHRLPIDITTLTHEKHSLCLYTYSAPKLNFEDDKISFYFSSIDQITSSLVESFENNLLVQLGHYLCRVSKIEELTEVQVKGDRLLLRSKALISRGDRTIITDTAEMERYLSYYAHNKLSALGLPTEVKFTVYKKEPVHTYYRNTETGSVNIWGWYITVALEGDPLSLNALYQVGLGHNTGTGNGLCWEVG